MTGEWLYPPGCPAGVDLTTLTPERTKDFYGSLLGWEFEDFSFVATTKDGLPLKVTTYTWALVDGKRVAGIGEPYLESLQNLPAIWNIYLVTKDVKGTAQHIAGLGGTVLLDEAYVPEIGHFTAALDFSGAPFVLWQQSSHLQGSDLYDTRRAMPWSEINTYDGPRTDAFYRSLVPYSRQQHVSRTGDDADYTQWFVGDRDRPVCERRELTRMWSDFPAQWLPYFKVSNCDTAAAEIEQKGGSIRKPTWDTPHGRTCIATDPDGVWFGICEPNRL